MKEGFVMWEIYTEIRCTEDGESYTAFGVKKEDCFIGDISTDRKAVERLVTMFNSYDASAINAADIAEDYLAEL